MLSVSGLTGLLAASFRTAAPLCLAAQGGVYSERSGVVNIGLEGMMLTGAFVSVLVTFQSGSPWLGSLCAVFAGVALALIHAVLSVHFRAEQIVSGVGINLLALGGTQFFCWLAFGNSGNSEMVGGFRLWDLPGLPPLSPLVFIAFGLVPVSAWVLRKTPFGLRLRAAGDYPAALESAGVSAAGIRYGAVLISGALSGLGGAALALETHFFVKNMSAGRGFIALAAVIFGKWRPVPAAVGCLLFGFFEALEISLQGWILPTQFTQMIPYLATMLVLAGAIGRTQAPAALGRPYLRESE